MEERANLMNMMKLSIKTLIQSALSLGRTLDSDFPPLQQFFVVLEHCLKHGLKGGRPLPRGRAGCHPRRAAPRPRCASGLTPLLAAEPVMLIGVTDTAVWLPAHALYFVPPELSRYF